MIYSYTRHINGFAAMLEEEEAADIAGENVTKTKTLFTNESPSLINKVTSVCLMQNIPRLCQFS